MFICGCGCGCGCGSSLSRLCPSCLMRRRIHACHVSRLCPFCHMRRTIHACHVPRLCPSCHMRRRIHACHVSRLCLSCLPLCLSLSPYVFHLSLSLSACLCVDAGVSRLEEIATDVNKKTIKNKRTNRNPKQGHHGWKKWLQTWMRASCAALSIITPRVSLVLRSLFLYVS